MAERQAGVVFDCQFKSLDAGFDACNPAADMLVLAEWYVLSIFLASPFQISADSVLILAMDEYGLLLDREKFRLSVFFIHEHISG